MSIEIFELIKTMMSSGLAPLMGVMMYSGYRRWWVWGWSYDQLKADYESRLSKLYTDYEGRLAKLEAANDSWKDLAIKNISVASQSASEHERLREDRDRLRAENDLLRRSIPETNYSNSPRLTSD